MHYVKGRKTYVEDNPDADPLRLRVVDCAVAQLIGEKKISSVAGASVVIEYEHPGPTHVFAGSFVKYVVRRFPFKSPTDLFTITNLRCGTL